MKKIFSFMLIAAGLLISGQVKAATPVGNEDALRNAITDAAVGATVDVVLTQSFAVANPIQIYAKFIEDGKTINLDLGGFELSSSSRSVFELFKGTLNIKNGTVSCTGAQTISVYGVFDDRDNWSILNIAKDAKIVNTAAEAIVVQEYFGYVKYPKYIDAESVDAGAILDGVHGPYYRDDDAMKAVGAKYYNTKGVYSKRHALVWVSQNYEKANNHVNLAKDGLIDYSSTVPFYKTTLVSNDGKTATYRNYYEIHGMTTFPSTLVAPAAKANGVKINIDGYVFGQKYGVKVNGNLKYKSTYMPVVKINETAEIACADNTPEADKQSCAIYCAGVAIDTIQGKVHGNIGVVVKSGDVVIKDAEIIATGKSYTAVTAGGSGMDGGSGCGVIIDSENAYGGGQNVTIIGDTKIQGESGYAIQEVIASGTTKVTQIELEGGTIIGGDKGAMNYTVETTGKPNAVTVYGATVHGNTTIGSDPNDTINSLKGANTFATTMVIDGEDVIIISKGTAPAAEEYSINAENIPASVIIKEETVELDGDKNLNFVQMSNETEVTVPTGTTLTVGKLLMGDDASIIVEPGATMIVSGEQGIVAGQVTNIILKADETGMGAFVLNPAVKSNRSPMATVEYLANEAKCIDGTQYRWNIFASPFEQITNVIGNASTKEQYPGKSNATAYEYFNGKQWIAYSSKEQLYNNAKPFQAIAITNNTKNGGVKYTFTGLLQGNNDGTFNLSKGFNYIGNGYTAEMTAKAIIDALKAAGAEVEASIWLWDAQNQTYDSYDADTYTDLQGGKIGSTNMIVIKCNNDVKVNLNYQELIWNQYKDL